jgi:hypothetical protein
VGSNPTSCTWILIWLKLLRFKNHYPNMKHEDEWDEWRYGIGIFVRIILALIIAGIVLGLIFSFGFGFFRFNWIWDLIGLLLLIWFLSWIFRWPWHHYRHEERILRRRYARGEINRTQFKRMMKDLKESRP